MQRWHVRGGGFWVVVVLVLGWIAYLFVVLTPPAHAGRPPVAPGAPSSSVTGGVVGVGRGAG